MEKTTLRRAAVTILCALLTASAANATSYPRIYVFGDSLSDAGNDWIVTGKALPLSPPYSSGRFSNGAVWVQDLAPSIGAGVLKASLAGGTDFAYGGAESGQTNVHQVLPIDLPGQLVEFGTTVGTASSNALIVLWIGANDLFDILAKIGQTQSQITEEMDQVVKNEANFVTAIMVLGARNLMIVTAPDLGVTPDVTSQGPAAAAAATTLSKAYNALLIAKMKSLASTYRLHLTIVDSFALIDGAVADHAKYAFTNVTKPCWTGSYTSDDGTLCSKTLAGQDKYLFWDTLHPTAKSHTLIAAAAKLALAAPTARATLAADNDPRNAIQRHSP